MSRLLLFLLGGLCGFVAAILILFLYASVRVGGERDE